MSLRNALESRYGWFRGPCDLVRSMWMAPRRVSWTATDSANYDKLDGDSE